MSIGGGPENAPDLKWSVTDRLDTPQVFLSLRRSLNGKLRAHRLMNHNGVVQLNNFVYTVKVSADWGRTLEQSIEALKAMNGQDVWLCDVFHANDGDDHTPDVRPMVLSRMGAFPPIGPGLQHFYVDIELEDNSL